MSDHTTIPDGYKRCNKCGEIKPLTAFWKDKRRSLGCRNTCAQCVAKQFGRERKHPIGVHTKKMRFPKVVPARDGYKRCTKCQQEKPATPEFFYRNKRSNDGLCARCQTCRIEDAHLNYAKHRDKYIARTRCWQSQHPGYKHSHGRNRKPKTDRHPRKRGGLSRTDYNAYRRQWRQENIELRRSIERETKRRYRARRPEVWQAKNQRRKALALSLPANFTTEDWERCLQYWGYCCAVCGRPRGLWHKIAADHWIALSDPRSDNPGTVVGNMLPLCHGQDSCNLSKGTKDPVVWLVSYLGERKAKNKLAEIEAYFEWAKSQEKP